MDNAMLVADAPTVSLSLLLADVRQALFDAARNDDITSLRYEAGRAVGLMGQAMDALKKPAPEPVADEVKAVVAKLRRRALMHGDYEGGPVNPDGPEAADLIERLARSEPAVPVAWMHQHPDEMYPVFEQEGPASCRLTDDEKKAGWTETPLYAHPPRTPDVEAVARAIYEEMHGSKGGRWECVEPRFQDEVWGGYARAAIAAMTGEAEHD